MRVTKKSADAGKALAKPKAGQPTPRKELLAELRSLILEARQRAAQSVNAGLTLLYWNIGTRIRQDILKEKRAEYGAAIVATV